MDPCKKGDWEEDSQHAGGDEGVCTECIAQVAEITGPGEIIWREFCVSRLNPPPVYQVVSSAALLCTGPHQIPHDLMGLMFRGFDYLAKMIEGVKFRGGEEVISDNQMAA